MSKSLRDFMDETGWNFEEAGRLFQEYRKNNNTREIVENNRVGLSGVNTSYNPYTGWNETINTGVGVNTGVYSMQNKQNMWEQYGNSGNFEMNAFYRGNDWSLQIKDEYKKNIENANNLNDINAYFNQNSIEKLENRNIIKSSLQGFEKYNKMYGSILTEWAKEPIYSAVENLEKRRSYYGMDELELKMNQLSKDMANLEANTRIRSNYASDKAIPMGAIAGRVGAIERSANERMDNLRREANYLNDQYKTRMNVISEFMKAGENDYEREKYIFETKYKRNREMLEDYKEDIKEEQKDARATLQTIYNAVSSGKMSRDNWSANMKNTIMKLEVQSGFPIGTIDNIVSNNPKSDIVQQWVSNVNGRQILNVVLRDENWGFRVENVDMGASTTVSDKWRYQYKNDGVVFDTYTGRISDGNTGGTDLRSIANKYPKEASLKNNNPAGITWSGSFDKWSGIAKVLSDNGIAYYKWTSRPANEGGNYVRFDSAEDGMKAQRLIMLNSYGNSTVETMLKKWVGTAEGPSYAREVAGNAGIDLYKKVNQLSEDELTKLQMAKIKKEAPGFYNEMINKKTENEYTKILSNTVEKLNKWDINFDRAHNIIYSRFNHLFKENGWEDDEIKQKIHNDLWGK